MTIHQCPKCELRFDWKTELDDHCWHDHPEFRHEYPAQAVAEPPVADAPPAPEPEHVHRSASEVLLGWMNPRRAPLPNRHADEPSPQRKPG